MTALTQYDRLEAPGLWRSAGQSQRRNVIVALGHATLVLHDGRNGALTHWSLPAVERLNPGETPAIYAPASEDGEELEIADDEMIGAIERIRSAVARRGPHPGRLRGGLVLGSAAAILTAAVFGLPGALTAHTATVVPPATRAAIGADIAVEVARIAGADCESDTVRAALDALSRRLFPADPPRLSVVPLAAAAPTALPGDRILVPRSLVEDYDAPDVLAGFLLSVHVATEMRDPLLPVLAEGGAWGAIRLLTTGTLPRRVATAFAESQLSAPPPSVPHTRLLDAFAAAGVSAAPYAYARDVSGEATLALIEADTFSRAEAAPLLPPAAWAALQTACTR